MTPSEREEIEKVAKEVCMWIPGNLHGIPAWEMRHEKCKRCEKITQAIRTQVDKARREAYEECAKIAEEYAEETGNNYEPKEIEKLIRNKLNQKGE